jgi:hypothetical protein
MTAPKKRKFSGFDLRGAMELLSLKDLERWQIDCQPVTPSPFLRNGCAVCQNASTYTQQTPPKGY